MAFKGPFNDVKTLAPLKTTDRRKLKNHVVQAFSLEPETGDILVPESILSLRFNTGVNRPGVAYFSLERDPLWFSLGEGFDNIIPTVYTLWKRPTLLPIISAQSAVIPILIGGADLMIPGVVQYPSHVRRTDVVAITRDAGEAIVIAPPLAIGRMAVHAEELADSVKDIEVVHVLHTFGDSLWDLGSRAEPPDSIEVSPLDNFDAPAMGWSAAQNEAVADVPHGAQQDKSRNPSTAIETNLAQECSKHPSEATPQEITAILRKSTIQAIDSQLSKLPPSAFPITSSTFYSAYILPSRPLSSQLSTPIDIKHSAHKNLTAFLKSIEKDGLLRLKDFKGDLSILSVNVAHPEIQAHVPYQTLKDHEKRSEREKSEEGAIKEMTVRELWKPHAQSVQFFEEIGKNPNKLYSFPDLQTVINEYTSIRNLANPREQRYIHPDKLLLSVLTVLESGTTIKYLKREEAVTQLSEGMQKWHQVVDGKHPGIQEGQLRPVVIKIKKGGKGSTLITGFETFFITTEFLSEKLKRMCATSTSTRPVADKGGATGVLLRGRQIKAATEFLISQGVPKRWIEVVDLMDTK